MLAINKKIVLDEQMKPFAVQIAIEDYNKLEELIENYGLAKMIDEVSDDEKLSVAEAKEYYQSLNTNAKG